MNETDALQAVPEVPAPWTLYGRGYVLIYRFPRAFAEAHSGAYAYAGGGIGAVMIVRYEDSPAGAYDELLFVPGMIALPGKTGFSISKIYVSTQISIDNGIKNWAIPKELALFNFERIDTHSERVQVMHPESGEMIADFIISAGGLSLPVTGALLPPLVQYRDDMIFTTQMNGQGRAQFAGVIRAHGNGQDFPPLQGLIPLAALKVRDFRLIFPIPHIAHSLPAE